MEKALVFADLHPPHHSPRAVDWAVRLTRKERPAAIFLDGDILDEASQSKFLKTVDTATLDREIEIAGKFFRDLRKAAPRAEMHWIFGNHDLRMEKRLLEHDPQLQKYLNTRTLAGLLECERLGVEVHGDVEKGGEAWWHDVLIVHDDVARKFAGQTALALIQEKGCNVVQAHVHRQAIVWRRFKDRLVWAAETGCLCLTEPRYARTPDWQQGGLLIHWTGKHSIPELRCPWEKRR